MPTLVLVWLLVLGAFALASENLYVGTCASWLRDHRRC